MSMEVLQPEWFSNNFLPIIAIIAASLFVVQAVFTFLLWRKGEKRALFNFISFAIAAFVLLIAGAAWKVALGGGGTPTIFYVACGLILIVAPIAIGFQVFFFIRDTWFPNEEGDEDIMPSKKKEATA